MTRTTFSVEQAQETVADLLEILEPDHALSTSAPSEDPTEIRRMALGRIFGALYSITDSAVSEVEILDFLNHVGREVGFHD